MSNDFESINSDDVISFVGSRILVNQSPVMGSHLIKAFTNAVNSYASDSDAVGKLIGEGLPCKVLRPGNQWVEGKLKVHIEFEPNPLENSPLDEFRTDA